MFACKVSWALWCDKPHMIFRIALQFSRDTIHISHLRSWRRSMIRLDWRCYPELSERFLKWSVKRHYKALGYKVSMRTIRLGSTEVDGEAMGPHGERIAIETKTPRHDLARGIGQLAEALAFVYDKAVLVTPSKTPEQLMIRCSRGLGLVWST